METLAIPLFGDDVAPRFCAADEFLVVPLERDGPGTARRTSVAGASWTERLSRLRAMGVTVLLCGGFNRQFLPLARGVGLRVESGLAGAAADLAAAYASGELERFRLARRLRGRRRRRRRRWDGRKDV